MPIALRAEPEMATTLMAQIQTVDPILAGRFLRPGLLLRLILPVLSLPAIAALGYMQYDKWIIDK